MLVHLLTLWVTRHESALKRQLLIPANVSTHLKNDTMNKKSLNRKEANKTIQEKIAKGVSREQILNELCEQYYDKSSIAKLIASTPDPMKKEQYNKFNFALLAMLLMTILAKIWVGITVLSTVSLFLIPLAFAFPLLYILFAFEVANFRGYIYRILGLIAIAGIFKILSDLNDSNIVFVLIDIVLSLIIAAIAFYIGHKVFPNYGLLGPRKYSNGEIQLS
jgi:hypothetical protein